LGRTPEERALILNWNHRLFGEVFSAIADTFRNAHPNYVDRALPGPVNVAQLPELAERGRMRLTEGFSMLNNALASKTFLAGDHVSFADIDLMVAIDFAKWAARMTPDQSLEHLHRWRVDTKAALEG